MNTHTQKKHKFHHTFWCDIKFVPLTASPVSPLARDVLECSSMLEQLNVGLMVSVNLQHHRTTRVIWKLLTQVSQLFWCTPLFLFLSDARARVSVFVRIKHKTKLSTICYLIFMRISCMRCRWLSAVSFYFCLFCSCSSWDTRRPFTLNNVQHILHVVFQKKKEQKPSF